MNCLTKGGSTKYLLSYEGTVRYLSSTAMAYVDDLVHVELGKNWLFIFVYVRTDSATYIAF